MLVAPSLLLLLVTCQTKPVTITFAPTPLPKALKLLSDASGLKLDVAKSMQDDVLLARLKEADPQSILAHIAESLEAKWEKMPDGTQQLKPDPVVRSRRKVAEEAEKLKTVLGSMNYLRKRLAEQPETLDKAFVARHKQKVILDEQRRKAAEEAKDFARMFVNTGLDEETPGWRATARLILLMSPKHLAELPNNAREVYAEKPTEMQLPFSSKSEKVLAQYRRELQVFNPELDPTRIRFIIVRWEHGGASNVSFQALGANDQVVDTGFARMNNDSDKLKVPYDVRTRVDPKVGEQPVKVAPDTIEYRKALSEYNDIDIKTKNALLKKWLPRLMKPTEFEPTANGSGADLIAAAEAADVNLIGTVGDLVGSRFEHAEVKQTASQVFAKQKLALTLAPDGWYVSRLQEVRERTSRSLGEAMLADSVKNGGITVDTAATFVGASKDKWPFVSWLGDHLQIFLPGSLRTTIDDESLRMWAGLTEMQKIALRRGDSIRITSLKPSARTQMEKLAFWFQGLGTVEPTEVLSRGINDGVISLKVSEKPVMMAWADADGLPDTQNFWSPATFGTYLGVGDSYQEKPVEDFRRMDRFRMGVMRTYMLRFTFNTTVPSKAPAESLPSATDPFMDVELSETLFDPKGRVLTELSPAIAAEVEKARLAALAKPKPKPNQQVIPPR